MPLKTSLNAPHSPLMRFFLLMTLGAFLFTASFGSVSAEEISVTPETPADSTENPLPEITETQDTNTPEKSENEAIQVLKDRQEKIQETLKPSQEEVEIKKSEEDLETVQIEKHNIEEINTDISAEVESLKSELLAKKNQELALKNSLKTEQEKNSNSEKTLAELQTNISALQKNISTKNILLERTAAEIDSLSQEEALKEYYLEQSLKNKQELERLTSQENAEKYIVFYIVTGVFFLAYIVRVYWAHQLKKSRKLRKKYAHRLTAFDVFSVLFYLGFLIWFLFYIKPELVVYMLFLVGALVIVLQEYLFSIVSSIFIVQRYAVGDRVRFGKREGIIETMTLLKVNIQDIDERGTNISELRVIPNSKFMKETVSLLPRSEVERFDFKLILPNDLSINEPMLVQRIEENILQKNITVKSFNEITETESFYDIDFYFTNTGHPVIEIFWYETREKSIRIKRKILAEIEIIKQELFIKGEKLEGEYFTASQDKADIE